MIPSKSSCLFYPSEFVLDLLLLLSRLFILYRVMSCTNLSQVRSLEEATELFEQALALFCLLRYSCIAMGNYKHHNEAEDVIQSIISHPSSDEVFKCSLYNSTNSYCIFYVSHIA